VLEPVDPPALEILATRDTTTLEAIELAIAQRPVFHPMDVALPDVQATPFASGQLTTPPAALDPLVLPPLAAIDPSAGGLCTGHARAERQEPEHDQDERSALHGGPPASGELRNSEREEPHSGIPRGDIRT
jgi:hypothetical protein